MANYPLEGFTDSTSLVNGTDCVLSINAGDNTKFDISAGVLKFIDNTTDPLRPLTRQVPVEAQTAITPTGTGGASFIYYDRDGIIVQEESLRFGSFIRNHVAVGILIHPPAGPIQATSIYTATAPQSSAATFADFSVCLGAVNNISGEGNRTVAGGSNLTLAKEAGSYYYAANNLRNSATNPNIVDNAAFTGSQNFLEVWFTTDGGGIDSNSTNILRTGVYDDGTATQADNGPVGVVKNNEWTNVRVFQGIDFNQYGVQYGVKVYGNPVAAQLGILEEDFVTTPTLKGTPPKAVVTLRGAATQLDIPQDAVIRQAVIGGFA